MFDKLGNYWDVGDNIIFPSKKNGKVSINIGKVIKINEPSKEGAWWCGCCRPKQKPPTSVLVIGIDLITCHTRRMILRKFDNIIKSPKVSKTEYGIIDTLNAPYEEHFPKG